MISKLVQLHKSGSNLKLEWALALAEYGYKVFPLIENTKLPACKNFQYLATTNKEQIITWWKRKVGGQIIEYNYNIGVLCGEQFQAEGYLGVLDIDNKNGKAGSDTLSGLQILHDELPPTFTVLTPTGGEHRYFLTNRELKNSVSKLGDGLDIRGWHGYVVGPGSTIDGKTYQIEQLVKPAESPLWLKTLAKMTKADSRKKKSGIAPDVTPDTDSNVNRAIEWLVNHAPEAIEGAGGDGKTFSVACTLKDMGISKDKALELLIEHWNEVKCSPPWDFDDLERKVANAYQYGKEQIGVATAEAQFDAVGMDDIVSDNDIKPLFSLKDSKINFMLESEPEPQKWIFKDVLPLGITGFMYAPGGTGKTMLALQMAIGTAIGINICNLEFSGASLFTVETPKAVVCLLSEDDINEIWRRVHRIVSTLNLNKSQKALLQKNLYIKSMVGEDNYITRKPSDRGDVVETDMQID